MEYYSIVVPPSAKPRGIAIADYGYDDSFEMEDNLTAAELAVFAERNAVVAFWLAENSYASVVVKKRARAAGDGTWFEFHYQVCDCQALYSEDGAVELGDPAKKLAARTKTWRVFCNGQVSEIECDPGYRGACVDGEVVCVEGAPG